MDIYRRIYRLANRNVPANQIAVTLGLPLKNVKDILKRLQSTKTTPISLPDEKIEVKPKKVKEEYLDVYMMQQSRVTVVDLNGYATEKNRVKLKVELKRVQRSDSKIIALMMTNLKELDKLSYELLLEFKEEFFSRGRFVAILDPSPEIENFIEENEVEDNIAVFGTVSALEAKASTGDSK